MNLNDLKPAWQQLKLMNAMDPLEVNDVLLAIDQAETSKTHKVRQTVLAVIMFVTFTIILQSG